MLTTLLYSTLENRLLNYPSGGKNIKGNVPQEFCGLLLVLWLKSHLKGTVPRKSV
jgi:hypothetical protein